MSLSFRFRFLIYLMFYHNHLFSVLLHFNWKTFGWFLISLGSSGEFCQLLFVSGLCGFWASKYIHFTWGNYYNSSKKNYYNSYFHNLVSYYSHSTVTSIDSISLCKKFENPRMIFRFSDLKTYGWNRQEAKMHMVPDFFSESEVCLLCCLHSIIHSWSISYFMKFQWKVIDEVLGPNQRHLNDSMHLNRAAFTRSKFSLFLSFRVYNLFR